MNRNPLIRKSKVFLISVLLLFPASITPTSAAAAEKPTGRDLFAQLLDGDVRLTPVGQRAGLHMTFKSPSDPGDAFSAVHTDGPGGNSGIHLSVRMPWK